MNFEPEHNCPLCHGKQIVHYYCDGARDYQRCPDCNLVFVPAGQHLSAAAGKAYYDLHENHVDDPGYRRFLDRLFSPLNERLAPNANGLDFGCGPGPTLSAMMQEAGHEMRLYDPIYYPNDNLLTESYDFITATEVFEHLHEPEKDLEILFNALNPECWLGIMTKRTLDKESFSQWHYIQDPTHVCFWSETTFHWLANQWQAVAEFTAADVVLIQKK